MKHIERKLAVSYFVAVAAMALSVYAVFVGGSVRPASAQADMYLSRRIDQVEQRFYSLESRLNRLESSHPMPVTPSPSLAGNGVEMPFLRTQIDSLRTRVGELECSVLHLDERTLPASVKATRRAGAKMSDKCRQDADTPVELSARP